VCTVSGLYSPGTLQKYVGKKLFENPPHVYAVAEAAYRNMILNHSDEGIVITGESGAGKTENSKRVMEYVAAMASKSKDVQRIKTQLLESNPLLEAFGNAKTVRNDNSSRFGKLMKILFKYGDPTGGKIQVYLLEKARVVHQLDGERNFHSFYQLFAGADSGTKSRLQLTSAGDFRYTKTCVAVRGIDDARVRCLPARGGGAPVASRTLIRASTPPTLAQDYADTVKAMEWCGLSTEEQRDVWRLVACILHLGNITFVDAPQMGSKAQVRGG
jgi:myosin-1